MADVATPTVPAGAERHSYAYDVRGPEIRADVAVQLDDGWTVEQLRGALEEKLGLRVGAVAELKWLNPSTELWQDVGSKAPGDAPPPANSKLWVTCREGPSMLEKTLVPQGSTAFFDYETLLQNYLRPFTRSAPGLRVHLTKAEEVSNPQCEHAYQERRRELFDPENVMLVTVGGAKDVVKNIAMYGFQLPTDKGQFGEKAMVFGSNVRSVGADGLPSPTVANKLLVCEAALGIPKIIDRPSPHCCLEELQEEGYNSVILPPGEAAPDEAQEDVLEYVSIYHAHQVVPRCLLTYSVEHIDPATLCPVSGDPYCLVHKEDLKLECLHCVVSRRTQLPPPLGSSPPQRSSPAAVAASSFSDDYETLEDANRREKAKFLAQQDAVSMHLRELRSRHEEVEGLHCESNAALQGTIDRVAEAVQRVTDAVRHAGLRLVEEAKERHVRVRQSLDTAAIQLQESEARTLDAHRQLSSAVATRSPIHFQQSLAHFRHLQGRMRIPQEGELAGDEGLIADLAFLQGSDVRDAASIVAACDRLQLHDPKAAAALQLARSPLHATPPAAPGNASVLPPPPSEPADPPSTKRSNFSVKGVVVEPLVPHDAVGGAPPAFLARHSSTVGVWAPPDVDVDPATLLTEEESYSSRNVTCMLLAFGRNESGQLGLGNRASVDKPAEVHMLSQHGSVRLVATGLRHTVCSIADGRVFAWGDNTRGQLGLGHRTSLDAPAALYAFGSSSASTYSPRRRGAAEPSYGDTGTLIDVACGDYHTLALTSAKKVFSWGRNDSGQLGLGHVDDQDTPWEVPYMDGHTVVKVAAGAAHSVCLTSESVVFSWGNNKDHQLGIGGVTNVTTATVPQKVMLPVPHGLSVVQIAAGGDHSLALLDNSTQLFAWGKNDDGRLGLGHTATTPSPRLVAAVNNPADPIERIVAGPSNCYAVTASGHVLHWGVPPVFPPIPSPLAKLSALCVPQIDSGKAHTLLLSAARRVYGFGDDSASQLGRGHAARCSTSGRLPADWEEMPQEIPLPAKFTRHRHRVRNVVAAGDHSFIVIAVQGSGPLGRP